MKFYTYLTNEPFVSDKLILRKRLLDDLNQLLPIPLMVIGSGAGTGKTSLLYSYKNQSKINTYWLQCSQRIHSGISLAAHMAYSVSRRCAGTFQNALRIVEAIDEGSKEQLITINDFTSVFCNDLFEVLNKIGELCFIMDDYHLLASGEHSASGINEFLNQLIFNPIKGFSLIISSRYKVTLDLTRLRTKRLLVEYSDKDLRFDNNEIAELSQKIYHKNLDEGEISLLKDTSNGWITGLHLMLQHWDKEPSLISKTEGVLYDYFITEILNLLSSHTKDFLFKSSFLEHITPSLCNYILEISNSDEIIKELLSKNIFIEMISVYEGVPTNQPYYKYQKLFKEFLTNSTPVQELEATISRTVEYFTLNKDYLGALDYLKLIKDEKGIVDYFENTIFVNEPDSLNPLFMWILNGISVETLKGNLYVLQYYVSLCDLIQNYNDNYLEMIEILSTSGNANILLLKANYHLHRGNLSDSEAMLTKIKVDSISEKEKLQFYKIYSRVLYHKGFEHFDETLIKAKKGLELSIEGNDKRNKADFCGIIGNLHNNKGEYVLALEYYQKAVDFENNIVESFKHLTNIANIHIALGNLHIANEKIEEALNLYDKLPLPSIARFIYRSQEKLYFKLTDYEACIEVLKKTINIESPENNEIMWAYNLNIANYYLYLSKPELAVQFLELAKNYSSTPYNRLLNQFMKAKVDIYKGDVSTDTEKILLDCIDFHIDNKLNPVLTQFYLETSKFYFIKSQYNSALHYLTLSFEAIGITSLKDFIVSEIFVFMPIFDFARHNHLGNTCIRNAVKTILEHSSSNIISNSARIRLEIICKKLTDIRFLPFGKTELYLRGELLTEDKWIRKRSKILLAYLMNDPEKVHTKEKIIDMFFDDVASDKSDIAYHSTVYNIRTALKIYDFKSEKPKRSKDKTLDYNPQYILYEDKTLRLNPDFYYISDNIEFENYYNKALLSSLTMEEKKTCMLNAISLYSGDFLPGYYDSWCEELRVKYKNIYITLCEELIRLLEDEEHYEEVIKYSEMLLNEDKLNDTVHISIINAYSKLGNINMAKSRFELMLKIYYDELGEKPPHKILEKINTILS